MNTEMWSKAVAFHGHECPGLAIGVSAVKCFFELYGNNVSQDEEVVCIVENDTCAVDAIQALVGCTFGKGNLIYMPHFKKVFNFYLRNSGKSVRLYFKDEVPNNMTKQEKTAYIMGKNAMDMFDVSVPVYEVPQKAKVMESAKCDLCGEFARKDKVINVDGKNLCPACLALK